VDGEGGGDWCYSGAVVAGWLAWSVNAVEIVAVG